MTVVQLVKSLTDAILAQAIREANAWHQKGLLESGALTEFSESLVEHTGIGKEDVLAIAEMALLREAANRFAEGK